MIGTAARFGIGKRGSMRIGPVAASFLLLLVSLAAACSLSDDDATNGPESATTASSTPRPSATPSAAEPSATPEPAVPTVDDLANEVLGLVPVKPANIDLFTSDYLPQPVYPEAYPEGSRMEPALAVERTDAGVRAELESFLTEGFGPDSPELASTMALFDDPEVIARVPESSLRAAFVLMNVTVGAPLIDAFLHSGVYAIELGWAETGYAFTETAETGADGKRYVSMSERYRYEHFAAVTPNVIHSLLHHDEAFSYAEDVIVIVIATIGYLQLVALHPELAYQGTELARFNNTFALALLNSHPIGSPELRLIVERGVGVLPGSPEDAPDFWTLIAEQEGSTPASPATRAILRQLLDADTLIPADLLYSRETAELMSGSINPEVLSPVERVRLSVLFTMISPAEIAALVELSPEETAAMFGLGEIDALVAGAP
jgi:hypothetical protein